MTEPFANEELTTDRLRLTPLGPDDADDMLPVLTDPSLYAYIGGGPPEREELVRRYTSMAAGPGTPDELWRNWIVRVRESDETVGTVQATLRRVDGSWEAHLGWIVGVAWQGNGYAGESMQALADWLWARGATTLVANINVENVASNGVARRIGLRPTDDLEEGEVIWRSG